MPVDPTLGEVIVGMLRAYLARNSLRGLGSINSTIMRDLIDLEISPCWVPKKQRAKAEKKPEPTESEWLDSLQAQPAMEGIDVRKEHGKYLFWCALPHNRVYPTRRRFSNWLLKADRGLTGQAAMPLETPKKRGLEEPHKWRAWLDRECPNSCHIGAENWDAIEIDSQRLIINAMKLVKFA